VAQDIKLIVYPVKDLEAAKTLYGKFLGAEPYADSPYYVGYKLGNLEVGLVPGGQEDVILSGRWCDDTSGTQRRRRRLANRTGQRRRW
jgi:catechol 2,3-dioxygenase-like lactoylglutathione lyase family enzyme